MYFKHKLVWWVLIFDAVLTSFQAFKYEYLKRAKIKLNLPHHFYYSEKSELDFNFDISDAMEDRLLVWIIIYEVYSV
jgi:hypothetical protein